MPIDKKVKHLELLSPTKNNSLVTKYMLGSKLRRRKL